MQPPKKAKIIDAKIHAFPFRSLVSRNNRHGARVRAW
jgi:hypothetical protein